MSSDCRKCIYYIKNKKEYISCAVNPIYNNTWKDSRKVNIYLSLILNLKFSDISIGSPNYLLKKVFRGIKKYSYKKSNQVYINYCSHFENKTAKNRRNKHLIKKFINETSNTFKIIFLFWVIVACLCIQTKLKLLINLPSVYDFYQTHTIEVLSKQKVFCQKNSRNLKELEPYGDHKDKIFSQLDIASECSSIFAPELNNDIILLKENYTRFNSIPGDNIISIWIKYRQALNNFPINFSYYLRDLFIRIFIDICTTCVLFYTFLIISKKKGCQFLSNFNLD